MEVLATYGCMLLKQNNKWLENWKEHTGQYEDHCDKLQLYKSNPRQLEKIH